MSRNQCFRVPGITKPAAYRSYKLCRLLFCLWLLSALWPAKAEEPDDDYLQVVSLVQQADTLNSSGKTTAALAKYQEAQLALQRFRKQYPTWKKDLVAFRWNYLTEKVRTLSENTAASARTTNAPSSEGQAASKVAPPSSTTQVKLVEAGTEPRTTLRFHPKIGDKNTVELTMKMNLETKVSNMETPPTKMPGSKIVLEATVKDVSAEGDITYETVVREALMVEEPDMLPQMAEAIRSSLTNLQGILLTGTFSNRGLSKRADAKAPAGAGPQALQAMDQMKSSFARMVVPLPDEPIGAGARWDVTLPVQLQGIMAEQTSTYELVTLESDRLTAKSKIVQRAAGQMVENPALPGAKLELVKMAGAGTSQITSDLGRLLPLEATVALNTELSMAMTMGTEKQPMLIKMDFQLSLKGK